MWNLSIPLARDTSEWSAEADWCYISGRFNVNSGSQGPVTDLYPLQPLCYRLSYMYAEI